MTFPFSYTTKPPTGGAAVTLDCEVGGDVFGFADGRWSGAAALGLAGGTAGVFTCDGCEVAFAACALGPIEAFRYRGYPHIQPKNKAKAITAPVKTVVQGSRRGM